MRRKHGLDEDRFTILVSAGGFGVGPVGHLIKTLSRLDHPARVVAICGRNEALRAELAELVRSFPHHSKVAFTVVGFTTEMDEFMTAADLFVGKPGGLTTSEALAKGLPMVVINPIPGQEERNSDHLLEEGVAIRCNNLPALAYKIDHLLDTPGKLARMAENARRLGKPEAAFAVVDRLVALCQARALRHRPRAVARPDLGRGREDRRRHHERHEIPRKRDSVARWPGGDPAAVRAGLGPPAETDATRQRRSDPRPSAPAPPLPSRAPRVGPRSTPSSPISMRRPRKRPDFGDAHRTGEPIDCRPVVSPRGSASPGYFSCDFVSFVVPSVIP
jgi:hypothetical protein